LIRRAHKRPAFPDHKGVRVNRTRTAVATVLAAAAFLGTAVLAPSAVADDGHQVAHNVRDNADITQFWYGDNSPRTAHKLIKAGQYYPIRVLWGNTDGAGYLKLNIYGPDGK
jgi:hypothetical protein